MKKKLVICIPILAVLLILAFLLSALLLPHPVLKALDDADQPRQITAAKELTYGTLRESKNGLAVFSDNNGNYTVYHADTDKVLTTADAPTDGSTDHITLDQIMGLAYYVVTKRDKDQKVVSSKLYSDRGELLDECQEDPEYDNYKNAFFVFHNTAYTLNKKGKIEKDFTVSEFQNLSRLKDADHVGKKYFYLKNNGYITVTDYAGNFVAGYAIDNTAYGTNWHVLENGNVLIQTIYRLPESEKKYDYFSGTQKFDLVTKILKVKQNKLVEKDLDFYIASIDNNNRADSSYDFDPKFRQNFAVGFRIEDGRLLQATPEVVILSNRLKIKASLNDFVPNPEGDLSNTKMPGVYLAEGSHGYTYLLNVRGKELRSYSDTNVEVGATYLATSSGIYDDSLDLVYDYKKEGYTIAFHGDTFVILQKEQADGKIAYARYYNGVVTPVTVVDSATSLHFTTGLYGIPSGSGTYTYYNGAGTSVGTFEMMSCSHITDHGIYLYYSGSGKCYRMTSEEIKE